MIIYANLQNIDQPFLIHQFVIKLQLTLIASVERDLISKRIKLLVVHNQYHEHNLRLDLDFIANENTQTKMIAMQYVALEQYQKICFALALKF